MTKRLVRFVSAGDILVGRLVMPKGRALVPVVVLLHGWRSNMNSVRNKMLAEELAEHGIGSLAIDFRGHGRSAGNIAKVSVLTQAKDLLATYQFLLTKRRIRGDMIAVVGASIGASTALYALGKYFDNPRAFNCAVLISPRTDFSDVPEDMYCFGEGNRRVENREMLCVGKSIDFYETSRHVLVPALVLHGEKDKSVPIAQSQRLIKSAPKGPRSSLFQLQVIRNGTHTLHEPKFRQQVVSRTLRFLVQHLK